MEVMQGEVAVDPIAVVITNQPRPIVMDNNPLLHMVSRAMLPTPARTLPSRAVIRRRSSRSSSNGTLSKASSTLSNRRMLLSRRRITTRTTHRKCTTNSPNPTTVSRPTLPLRSLRTALPTLRRRHSLVLLPSSGEAIHRVLQTTLHMGVGVGVGEGVGATTEADTRVR